MNADHDASLTKDKGRSVLLVGGTRSGKSDLALRFAERVAPRRIFIATATVGDAETRTRVERHQQQRGAGWTTVEAPLEVLEVLQGQVKALSLPQDGEQKYAAPAIVLDCITFWLFNLQEQGLDRAAILDKVRQLAAWVRLSPLPLAVVSSELGQGLVPATPMGRAFRDVAGEANQVLAAAFPHVVLVSCGLPLALKGIMPEELR